MILTDKEIEKSIAEGTILIEPYRADCLGTNSYDVHLGRYLAVYKNHILDAKKHNEIEEIIIPDEGFVIHPGILYLGVTFLFACSDFNIYVYDADNFQLKNVLHGHDNSVFSIALNPSGTRLVSGSRDAQLKVWDVQNNYTCLMTIPAHMFTINDIVFSPDGKLMATAGRDKHIKIWDAEAFNLLKVIDREKFGGHINSVNKLFWSNWNNYLISCGDDKAVMVWEIVISEKGM
jgi:WD40 repeat protein